MNYLKHNSIIRGNLRLNEDPLDVQGGDGIDLSYPLLPAGNAKMTIAEATVSPNKKQTGNNFVLKWKNAEEVTSTKGDVLPPGRISITSYIGLTVTDKRTAKQIQADVERLRRGAGLPAMKLSEIRDNPSILAGKTMVVKVGVRQETDEYPESNEIKSIILEG